LVEEVADDSAQLFAAQNLLALAERETRTDLHDGRHGDRDALVDTEPPAPSMAGRTRPQPLAPAGVTGGA